MKFARATKQSVAASSTHDDELRGYVEALDTVAEKMAKASDAQGVIQAALDSIRTAFQCNYASCWWIDTDEKVLKFRQESGQVGTEFRNVTQSAKFPHGVGLAGRAWRENKLLFAPDLADVSDCVRAPVAKSSGILSAVAFPLVVEGKGLPINKHVI